MHQYIKDTKYCTAELIKIIYKEDDLYHKACLERDLLLQKSDFYYKEYISKDMSDDFCDLQAENDFHKMAKAKKEATIIENNIKNEELDNMNITIENKKYSLIALSGSLLQIAKQGLSLKNDKDGRKVGREKLKNIIWQSRNQLMHFEEGKPHPPVIKCFKNLEMDFGKDFSLENVKTKNLAKKIIDLLNWKIYENYEKDMIALLE